MKHALAACVACGVHLSKAARRSNTLRAPGKLPVKQFYSLAV